MTGESVTEVSVLQKLLMPWQSRDVLRHGSSALGGAVVGAGDALALSTPQSLVAAYLLSGDRFGPQPPFVDVVRFKTVPLMRLEHPSAISDVPWPTYPTGFLRSTALIPVWMLQRTRYPQGAECWRIHADGSQEQMSTYDGAGRGWRGATLYAPPDAFTGPRGEWHGVEFAVDFVGADDAHVELIATGDSFPDGFRQTRPMVATRVVPVAECERVFDRVVTCTRRGASCRILGRDSESARLLVTADEADTVQRLDAGEVEPGVFEVTAPLTELVDLGGYLNEFRPSRP